MRKTPVVVVLGHVDHGKTTLLDTIRTTTVAAREPGGITQSIGAYQVTIKNSPITFIDTPGHEAFSAMRSQGARVADLAILVVAADDGVKPQTMEALQAVSDAHLPMIVAVNKIDLPHINTDAVKKDLGTHGCLVEGYGGSIPVIEISAKEGRNVAELLEMVQLVYALEEKTADEKGILRAAVVESTKDTRVGPVASVIVESGTLRLKDEIVVGGATGRVRTLYNDRKQSIRECLPGFPALVVGFPLVLPVGSIITRKGETHSAEAQAPRDEPQNTTANKSFTGEKSEILRLLLKADSQGTLAALAASIPTPSAIVYQSVGDIALADVLLAETTKAFIVGFRVKIPKEVTELADEHRVTILTNDIIYALNEQLTTLIKRPVPQETELGRATVRQIFHVRDQQIAGCHVESGRLSVNDTIHLIRAANSMDAVIRNLKQKNADVTSVPTGQDCGVLLAAVSGEPLNIRERSAIIAFQKNDNIQ